MSIIREPPASCCAVVYLQSWYLCIHTLQKYITTYSYIYIYIWILICMYANARARATTATVYDREYLRARAFTELRACARFITFMHADTNTTHIPSYIQHNTQHIFQAQRRQVMQLLLILHIYMGLYYSIYIEHQLEHQIHWGFYTNTQQRLCTRSTRACTHVLSVSARALRLDGVIFTVIRHSLAARLHARARASPHTYKKSNRSLAGTWLWMDDLAG